MNITKSIIVNASANTIWELLIERLRNPERYLPGVEKTILKELNVNEFLRTLTYENGVVVEMIVIDKENMKIQYNLVKHPHFSGKLVNQVENRTDDTFLTFSQDWIAKTKRAQDVNLENILEDTLQQTKIFAELDEQKIKQ